MWGSAADSVFAVGGTGGWQPHRIILYVGEVSWDTLCSGQAPNGVWGRGPDDLFAVGSCGTILYNGP